MVRRRRFLEVRAALGVSQTLPSRAADRKVSFDSYPFTLGVASGYPSPGSVVVWTRLVGDLDPVAVPVRWELAADEAMKSIIFSGVTSAEAEWAHAVHVEVPGLAPDRWYWYRFTAGDARSPIGRTRTAPAAAAPTQRLRFAFASCQQYEQGFFGAYRHIVADQPDLVAFLGDYIYESSWGSDLVRSHDAPEPYSLADYRARHALHRSDPDLQAAHAACPWIVTWDDHEVDNDYADDRPEDGMARDQFLERRAAPTRTMLGRAQERWLENALADSRAGWNVIAQQTAMAQFDQKPGPGRRAWTDGWDGYPAARKRLLDYIASEKIRNAVVIGGDVHSFNVSQLKLDFDDPDSAGVASEVVGTSITSQAWPQERLNQYLPDNPHTLLADSRYRGHVRVELTPQRRSADLRAMETVQKRDAVCNTLASFVVEDGKPGPLKA